MLATSADKSNVQTVFLENFRFRDPSLQTVPTVSHSISILCDTFVKVRKIACEIVIVPWA